MYVLVQNAGSFIMSLHIYIFWGILAQEDCLSWTQAVKLKSHNRDCWTPAAEWPWTLWKYFSVCDGQRSYLEIWPGCFWISSFSSCR